MAAFWKSDVFLYPHNIHYPQLIGIITKLICEREGNKSLCKTTHAIISSSQTGTSGSATTGV